MSSFVSGSCVEGLLVSALLPLFPLDLVLLPGVPVPLHIFEPRYKEMITECLDQNQHFGIVRAKEEELAKIGCPIRMRCSASGTRSSAAKRISAARFSRAFHARWGISP